MSTVSRRRFLEESMIAAGIAAASQWSLPRLRAGDDVSASPNETIRHAVIGCRIRGRVHASEFASIPGVEVACVCDPDIQLANELAAAVEAKTGNRPQIVQDLRRVMDDSSIDTVSIAAPNHWHALAAIWAMQGEKDVYVEKPVSHNVSEGRRMIQVAEKYGRICQCGTQNRSRGDLAVAAEYIRAGKLGDITLARTIVYGRRDAIGARGKCEIPTHVDFDLWLGPGTQPNIVRPELHYDWHWSWDTGSGELGNNNIHYVDICRWLLGLQGLGDSAISVGGRVGYEDAGETPNTQLVVHSFGRDNATDLTLIQEVRGLKTDPFSEKFRAGHVIHGSEGFIAEGSLFDPAGELIKTFEGPSSNHFENFIQVVRSRRQEDLRAPIVEGHQSSALCHVGNISYRLGRHDSLETIVTELQQYHMHDEVGATLARMATHLQTNGVDLDKSPLTIGPYLRINSAHERFDRDDANQLLTREYRAPFVVPSESQV